MNSPKTRKFAVVCLLIFLSVIVFASESFAKRLPVKIYTSADGLGSSFVDYLVRDSRGFMWFCTRDGLSRFDGSRFVNYQIGNKNSPPGIESIFESSKGIYWISTTGGTYRFDPRDIPPPDAETPLLNAEFVTGGRGQFFEDSRGNLYLTSGVLSRIVEQDGKTVLEKVELDIPSKPNNLVIVNEMTEAADGSLWLEANVGIIRLLPDKRTVFYPLERNWSANTSSILIDKNGRIWNAGTESVLVFKPEPIGSLSGDRLIIKSLEPTQIVELKPDSPVPMPEKSGEIFQFKNDNLNRFVENSYAKRLFQTSDGDVWITAENNLLQFSGGIFRLHHSAEGLPNVMSRMAEDAAGNLWIGGHAGLGRLDRQGFISFDTDDGLNSTRLFTANEDAGGEAMYFVGRDFYLSRFDGTKFQTVRPAISPKSTFFWTSRFGFRARNGDWWFLTSDKLYRFANAANFAELDGKQPLKIYTKDDGLGANGMFQIYEDSGGAIWISTRSAGEVGKTVARMKSGEQRFYTFSENEGLPKGKAFSSAAEDDFGNIWFSFYEGGVARFNGERFEYFGENEGLPVGLLSDLHKDKKGRLWISSTLGGLIRIDDTSAKKPQFVYLTTADGLRSNNIRTITEDNFGRIYAGSARGVDRISPDTGKIKHYSVSDGLAADFVVDSHCDRKGDLWFVTNNGLSRLTPPPDEKVIAPRILLGGLRIAGVEQEIPTLGTLQIEKGELSHTQNNLQIEFFGLDFRAGETLRFQYKLEGADADWSLPTELRTVTYGNLSPANYRFFVRAVNSDGIVSENEAMISFKILPPIWARWWFILLAALLVTFVIIMLYHYRTARLREINQALAEANRAEENLRKSREERLAELEKVRSRIATDLHDDIGASLTQISILSEVAQAQSRGNGATESLTKITNVSNELVGTLSDIVWSINPSKDHLSDLTQRMRRFASDVLSAKGIAFQFSMPEASNEIIVNTNVRREVFLIFKEAVNNIVKHSEADQVLIKLDILRNNLTLAISDDGKGFAPEKSFENSLSSIEMGGNGVLSMKKRATEMNGEFEIVSERGKGTEILLKLPLNNLEHPTRTGGDISIEKA